MIRKGFKMKVDPQHFDEYKRRHDEIWPELRQLLADSGVRNYSIFLDKETNLLFAYQELTDDNTADSLPEHEIMKKWWAYMKDIMDANPDNSPVVIELQEVFHLD